jgi:cytochrome c2
VNSNGILIALTAAAAFFAAACGSKTTQSSNAVETMSPGERVFRASCQSCHVLPRPTAKTDEEWPEIVQRYGSRARLSAETMAQISAYLIASN